MCLSEFDCQHSGRLDGNLNPTLLLCHLFIYRLTKTTSVVHDSFVQTDKIDTKAESEQCSANNKSTRVLYICVNRLVPHNPGSHSDQSCALFEHKSLPNCPQYNRHTHPQLFGRYPRGQILRPADRMVHPEHPSRRR